ncbi:MAG: 2-hydroxychromene-2-carboxylate isomerase [Pseudomonadota bacterium]
MQTIDWYFDFVSPFAYLASQRLDRIEGEVVIVPKPVLFAGFLNRWETKGPAEIPEMRRYTFRHISWLAQRNDIPLTLPPAHPFNPLKLLRLATACDASMHVVDRLFRFVWQEGKSSDDPEAWHELTASLELAEADALVSTPAVKQQLIDQTQRAIEKGIFGVPSFVIDEHIFWGFDAIDFINDYLADQQYFDRPNMQAVDAMPVGVARR